MSNVHNIAALCAWLEKQVCCEVLLKRPREQDAGDAYQYELIHPSVFALFLPTPDRLPPEIPSVYPSICVRILEGRDEPREKKRRIRFQLLFCVWEPGIYNADRFTPTPGQPGTYDQQGGAGLQLQPNGWADVWNFLDVALRKLENASQIGGMTIAQSDGIRYGPLSEQDSIPDFYPCWYAWLDFWAEERIERAPEYLEFL